MGVWPWPQPPCKPACHFWRELLPDVPPSQRSGSRAAGCGSPPGCRRPSSAHVRLGLAWSHFRRLLPLLHTLPPPPRTDHAASAHLRSPPLVLPGCVHTERERVFRVPLSVSKDKRLQTELEGALSSRPASWLSARVPVGPAPSSLCGPSRAHRCFKTLLQRKGQRETGPGRVPGAPCLHGRGTRGACGTGTGGRWGARLGRRVTPRPQKPHRPAPGRASTPRPRVTCCASTAHSQQLRETDTKKHRNSER